MTKGCSLCIIYKESYLNALYWFEHPVAGSTANVCRTPQRSIAMQNVPSLQRWDWQIYSSNYLIGMRRNGCAHCPRINLSHHFSVPPQIQRQSANAGMTAVIFPLSHRGGASSPRRCTVSKIQSRRTGANHPCVEHNAHTHGITHTDTQ